MTKHEKLIDFWRDRRGVFAIWLGLSLVPLLICVGAGVDMMRAVSSRAELQSAVDAAALAGATAYVSSSTSDIAQEVAKQYMAAATSNLNSIDSIKYEAKPSFETKNGNNVSLYKMEVTASMSQKTSLGRFITNSTSISVTAIAQNPVYSVNFTLSQFNSSASDANYLYWYIVPSSGGVPSNSDLNLLYSNVTTNITKASSTTITAGQKIAFALKNVTGGRSGYGGNYYGGVQGSTHYFYSHLMPPSSITYPKVTQNCSFQTKLSGSSDTVKSGSCTSIAQNYASLNCSENSNKTVIYSWNDMGGPSDDRDYDDAVYSVACGSNASTNQTGVILIK
jgi:Flp pilus assembly protein TadG